MNKKGFRDFTQEFVEMNNNEINYNTDINNINKLINDALLNNKFKSELGYYLAGLIESDGSIIIPKLSSNNTSSVTISFHENDKPLAKEICNILGYGSLELIPLNKAVKIHIRGNYSILNLLRLINGKFRTPKIEKLNNLITYINKN
jgi:LAGLIDADG endonuclease